MPTGQWRLVIYHLLLFYMLNWFEVASEYLKEQHKPHRDAMRLIEVFYEVAMVMAAFLSLTWRYYILIQYII